MTKPLPHASQFSLGETCASYLEYITANLPTSLHTFHHKLVTPLVSGQASTPLRSLPSLLDWASYDTFATDKAPIFLSLTACVVALVVMSWRNLWRRPSPAYNGVPGTSHHTERPYTYLTPDDIVDPPARTYDNSYNTRDDETEPDKLILNHRKVTYELHFPAYSINDGILNVGQLRKRAAEATHTVDPNRIKLLYKGKLLDNDSLPCRSEGLKQESEVMCVVSEVASGLRTPSDLSDADKTSDSVRLEDAQENSGTKKSGKKGKGKGKNKGRNKGKNKVPDGIAGDSGPLAPPAVPQRPSSSGRSSLPPSAPNLNTFGSPLEQVYGLTAYFHEQLLPLCDEYIANPPQDPKARDFEHKKLGETILAQVILKADCIEPSGDETRNARRALIKETQTILTKLDLAAKN